MKQSDLNRAVASATGETVSMIRAMGFVPLMAVPFEREPEDRAPLAIDWDEPSAEVARPLPDLVAV